MIKATTMKASLCVAALFLSLSTGVKVQAETISSTSDTGVAGIASALDTYYEVIPQQEIGAAEVFIESLQVAAITEVVSPYATLGISIAGDYVNIRKEPNTESEVVGKLYEGCATDILETDGDWVKIHSGDVDGYINKDYLAIGEEAESLIDKYASKFATVVNTETLRVREEQNTDSATTTLIPEGERYLIVKEYDDWVEIQIDDGDTDEGGETGFVSKEYINIDVEFEYAISIEEEQAKIAAEEAAKQAEIERLEELAQEQEEERKAEEAEKAAAQSAATQSNSSKNNTSSNNNSSSNNNNSSSNNSSSSSKSGSGQEIADYAVNFVGNRYVWGGTSLTGGADCSGFVQSLYSHFGRSIPRTSGEQSGGAGYEVNFSDRQPGDLIFYCNSSGSVNHVAMYIGNNKVVHASNAREGIKISSYNYRDPYKIRRVFQ